MDENYMQKKFNKDEEPEIEHELIDGFDKMGLKKELLHGIYNYGFENPTIIQQKAIVPMISGRDLIAQSQSGTGKTGTFSISTLQRIDEKIEDTQAIVLSPTRELAKQTYNVMKQLSTYTKITIREAIGGYRQFAQYKDSTAQVVVGTPGKVLDDLSRGKISHKDIKLFVLDEADEMLSKGFTEQIQKIFKYLTKDTQIVLFSATLPLEILDITRAFMNDPYKILVKTEELTLEGIKQYYVDVDRENCKFETLCDLYGTIAVTQCIIFCNTRKKVYQLTNRMLDNNFAVSSIYGDMTQQERNKILNNFRIGDTRVLITTDILARGIDVQQVSLVINYDLPNDVSTYIHRIGRSGRGGRTGVGISFVVYNDMQQLRHLERYYNTQIEALPENISDLLG